MTDEVVILRESWLAWIILVVLIALLIHTLKNPKDQ